MNFKYKKSKLFSFDGCDNVVAYVSKPDRYHNLFESIKNSNKIIARGSGLSYCNASANIDSTSIDTERFNRILHFDLDNGYIEVESGLKLGSLLDFVVSNGYYLSVLPGHPMITIGGCVAFNVHGKSQFNSGNFINCVKKLRIYHPEHGEFECSREKNADLFFLTIGGFGLTGFITSITIKLEKLLGNHINLRRVQVKNLFESVDILNKYAESSRNVYSWNNLNLNGSKFGLGTVYIETIENIDRNIKSDYQFLGPRQRRFIPLNLFNNTTTRLINIGYALKERLKPKEEMINIYDGSFPINKKEIYYKFFGSVGFREYQMLIPRNSFENFVIDIQKEIKNFGICITLGSLKLFKGNTNYLNFSGDGICLTINVPAKKQTNLLFENIDKIVCKYKGLANLAKDSRLSEKVIKNMYSEFNKFKKELNNYDPEKRFYSNLRQRINV